MAINKPKVTGSKGHIDGDAVTGGHTTVIGGADDIIKKWSKYDWFHQVQPSHIKSDKSVGGGKKRVTVKQLGSNEHENSLDVTFKISGAVQDCTIRVHDFKERRAEILSDMKKVVQEEWRGSEFTTDIRTSNATTAAHTPNLKGAALAAKFQSKRL